MVHIRRMYYIFTMSVMYLCMLFVIERFILYVDTVAKEKIMFLNKEMKQEIQPPRPSDDVGETECQPEYYDAEELKPYLQRLPQNSYAPGADGRPFKEYYLSSDEKKEKERGEKNFNMNVFASDRISLHRELGPDPRSSECISQMFKRCPPLPATSVIIVFHQEPWSALMRTVYSVMYTSPRILLKEIILVDDCSPNADLKGKLDDYIKPFQIVKLIRLTERKGLIQARLMGASVATAETLTFLDAHCECHYGWLEPLLARIAENPMTVVSPDIYTIDERTFEFQKEPLKTIVSRGIFDWTMTFQWHVNETLPLNRTFPIKTPTIAGGIFSISRKFFYDIGTYDEEMRIWGSENLELSFRVWQCGGQLELLKCSAVGHVYRIYIPHSFPSSDFLLQNKVRLVEVWLDNYKELFYRRMPMAAKIAQEENVALILPFYSFLGKLCATKELIEGLLPESYAHINKPGMPKKLEKFYGDVSKRLQLRQKLQCKSFDWYLKNVYPEGYIPEFNPLLFGYIKNIGSQHCISMNIMVPENEKLTMERCDGNGDKQYFEYSKRHEILHTLKDKLCLIAEKENVIFKACSQKMNDGTPLKEEIWEFKMDQLFNLDSNSCLAERVTGLLLESCNSSDTFQKWEFKKNT